MSKASKAQVLRYKFDNFMAKGSKSIFISLTVVFLAVLGFLSLMRGVIMALAPNRSQYHLQDGLNKGDGVADGFFHQVYIAWLQMTDPGNMAQDIGSTPLYWLPSVLAGIAGIILSSILIAVITTAILQKLEDLRRGKSKVIEDGQTLILGWDEQRVVEILRELIIANESEDNPSIVVLAETPKEEMDDYLALVLPETQNTRVVTRSGSTSSLPNLQVASVESAKSVIVLGDTSEESTTEQKNESDAKVIKMILAVAASRADDDPVNIVAEFYNHRHADILQKNVAHPITVLDTNDVVAKVIVQTSRSEGLSVVYAEILSFDGCEMYFYGADWGGMSFDDVQFHFTDGICLGIRSEDGALNVHPEPGTELSDGDEVLILAEDDSTIDFVAQPVATPRDLALRPGRIEPMIENELIIGWNAKAPILIREYDEYVLEGSSVTVMLRSAAPDVAEAIRQLDEDTDNISIRLLEQDPMEFDNLVGVDPANLNNIIILSRSGDNVDSETTDSETLMILLLLRNILDAADTELETKLITEVMDSSNQELVSRAGVKDFIISNRLISNLLAQLSEEADMKRVYDDLFQEDGSEIYLKPAATYFDTFPVTVSYADCIGIANKRAEICLGVKVKANEHNAAENFGVKLIPEKTKSYTLNAEDCLVVLAEDDT